MEVVQKESKAISSASDDTCKVSLMSQDIEDMDPAEILERAAQAREAGETETAAKMFNAVGNIYMSVAEFEEAHKCFSDSLDIYKELKDETGVCDTMYNLGVAQINLERWDEAIGTLEAAKKMFDKAKNDSGAADVTYGLALANLGQGGFDAALGHFKKAQKAYNTLDNQQGVASVIMDIGAAYVDKEDWTVASTTIKKALKVYREIEDKAGIADALSLLGDIAETGGNQKKAAEHFVEAAQNYYEAETSLRALAAVLDESLMTSLTLFQRRLKPSPTVKISTKNCLISKPKNRYNQFFDFITIGSTRTNSIY